MYYSCWVDIIKHCGCRAKKLRKSQFWSSADLWFGLSLKMYTYTVGVDGRKAEWWQKGSVETQNSWDEPTRDRNFWWDSGYTREPADKGIKQFHPRNSVYFARPRGSWQNNNICNLDVYFTPHFRRKIDTSATFCPLLSRLYALQCLI